MGLPCGWRRSNGASCPAKQVGGHIHTYGYNVLPSGLPPSWPPVPEVSPVESAPVSFFAHCPPPLAEVTDTSRTYK